MTRNRGAVRPHAARSVPVKHDDVPGAEADQGLTFPADMGQHEFAALALLPWQHGTGLRRNQLRMEHVERHEMKIVVMLGLAGEIAEDVRDAVIGIARPHSPGSLQAAAELRIVEAGFTAEQTQTQAQIAWPQRGKMLGEDALQHRGIRRRAGDRIDAEFADGANEQLRIADTERHDGGAGSL